MRVVRSGDVDYIDIGVGEHFVIAVIHPADIVFFGKSHSLAVRPVTYGKQISSVFLALRRLFRLRLHPCRVPPGCSFS